MGTMYIWDIGFDLNAVQTNGQSFLQSGFVNVSVNPAVPAAPVNLQTGDTVGFNGFNVTAGAQPSDSTAITGGTITLTSASTGNAASPFEGSTLTIPDLGTANSTPKPSAIFSGSPMVTTVTFPAWEPVLAPLTITNNGSFLMTITLNVKDKQGNPRTFFVDPEMVVGGFG